MNVLAGILAGKGFRHAWVIDSEFRQPWGERPTPHCIVAHCVITGETLRLWVGDGPSPPSPFALDRSELFIAYAADAEVGCFFRLGWPAPLCILDLFPEFLRMMNGRPRQREHDGLIDALVHFGEPSMGADEKNTFRALAMRGGPYTDAEKKILIDYCETDVEATERLLCRMWAKANLDDPKVFNQALWRGRYAAAVAAIRATGVAPAESLYRSRFKGTPIGVESFQERHVPWNRNIDKAMLGMPLTTRLGWTLEYPPNSLALASPRTAQNFPVQANAAEMMRCAAIVATEAGLKVCCPVHDAFLVEASDAEIDATAAELVRIMGDASEAILGAGYRIGAEVKIARWPEPYRETRGLELFNILVNELAQIEG